MAPRKAAALRGEADGPSLREHLIATAERMIADQDSATLTVRAIARAAGVAAGVLYNHFADKEELLANALHAHVRAVGRGLGALPEPGAGTVEANLRVHVAYGLALHKAILPAFAGLLTQPAVLARFTELDDRSEHWRDKLLGYLRAEQNLGRLAENAQVDAAAAMIVGVCHETVLSALLPSGAPANTPAIETIVTAVLDGIA